MAFEGEFNDGLSVVCPDCGKCLRTEVLHTPAGYYLGHFCPIDGPYDRQTEYMTEEMAQEMLQMWIEMDDAIFTRSTEFNG